MTYFAFPGGWGVYNLNGIGEKELALTGAHGYATEAEAEAHVNASPSPDQEALLQTFNASSLSPVGAGVGGVLSTPSGTGGISGLLSNAFNLNLSGNNAQGQPVHLLTRGLKILIGGILIISGLMRISGADKDVLQLAKGAVLA